MKENQLLGNMDFLSWFIAALIAESIMGGGNGAGSVPMSEMYAEAMNLPKEEIFPKLHASVSIGNWFAIFSAIALNIIGHKCPKLNGNGVLMKGYQLDEGREDRKFTMDFKDLGAGLMLTMTFFILGRILNAIFPVIHSYAWMIIAVVACKLGSVLPERMEFAAVKWYEFAQGTFTICLSAGLGIAMMDLASLLELLKQPGFVFVALAVVTGAVLGAGLLGMGK